MDRAPLTRAELASATRATLRAAQELDTTIRRLYIELEANGAPIELALLASVRESVGVGSNGLLELARTLETAAPKGEREHA